MFFHARQLSGSCHLLTSWFSTATRISEIKVRILTTNKSNSCAPNPLPYFPNVSQIGKVFLCLMASQTNTKVVVPPLTH